MLPLQLYRQRVPAFQASFPRRCVSVSLPALGIRVSWKGFLPCLRQVRIKRGRSRSKSSRSVQQMHPLSISMTSSVDCVFTFFSSSASSMPTSPNSFSMIAIFLPCCAVRMWFKRVVLPLPRKPVRIVTGTFEVASEAASDSVDHDAAILANLSTTFCPSSQQ